MKREDRREFDERLTLYCEGLGKVSAKTISTKKILSKLSPHLIPGNVISARLVEKNELQLVDALKVGETSLTLTDLYRVDYLLEDEQPDREIWNILLAKSFDWIRLLSIAGWDGRHATCSRCFSKNIYFFDLLNQVYLCEKCQAYQTAENSLLLIMIAN